MFHILMQRFMEILICRAMIKQITLGVKICKYDKKKTNSEVRRVFILRIFSKNIMLHGCHMCYGYGVIDIFRPSHFFRQKSIQLVNLNTTTPHMQSLSPTLPNTQRLKVDINQNNFTVGGRPHMIYRHFQSKEISISGEKKWVCYLKKLYENVRKIKTKLTCPEIF